MAPLSEKLNMSPGVQKIIFVTLALFCLTPFISAPVALLLGIIIAQVLNNPFPKSHKLTSQLLKISVIGLGFGMNVYSAMRAGKEGFIFTVVSIFSVLILGFLFTRIFKVDKIIGYLISAGTAICGGSAIAAVAPVVQAKENQISVALAAVFILNSVALLIFPYVGHLINLSQTQFGLWCAIAIHDTSSVVGAAAKFGDQALEVATTVKLARALWIIPVSFLSTFLFKNKSKKIKIPYFIGLFVVAMLLNTYVPFVQSISSPIVAISKAGLTLTLFLIGTGLTYDSVKTVGIKPLILAILLWIIISVGSLLVIMN